MTNKELYSELENITQKIEQDTATLSDYQRYELLLLQGGLTKEYIYSYLNKAGFNSWQEFIDARKDKEKKELVGAVTIGGLIGLGVGLLIKWLLSDD
jgi:hypothetical protein